MRIAVIGPLHSQFLSIQRQCAKVLGTRHTLYWVDKESSMGAYSCTHCDVIILSTAWIKHRVTEQARRMARQGIVKVRLVHQRGTSSVIREIEELITKPTS